MIRFILFLITLLPIFAFAQTAPPVWVKFPAGLAQPLTDGGADGEARLPIQFTPDSPPPGELDARVLNVVTQQPRPTDLVQRFSLAVDAGDEKRGPALVVKVQPMLDRPGGYTIVAELRSKKAQPALTQPFELQIERPAAQVAANSPLVVEQVWKWFNCASVTAPALNLRERSLRAQLHPLKIEDRSEHPSPTRVTAARLEFPNAPKSLGAGETTRLNAAAPTRFPLGTTSGRVEISAPQLAEPVVVAYEVRAKVHPGWLVALSLLGLGFGYLVRIGLQVVQERSKGRLALLDVRAQLNGARAAHPDGAFRAAIDEALRTLDAKLGERDPAQISAAALAAATALNEALTALARRRQQLDADLAPLLRLVRTERPLPPAAHAAREECERALLAANAALDNGDVTGAQAALDAVRADVLPRVIEAVRVWRRDAGSYFNAFTAARPPLLSGAAAQLEAAVKAWRESAGTLPTSGASLAPETLSSALDTATRWWLAADDIAQQFPVWSAAGAQEVRTALPTPWRQPDLLDRLTRETAAFAGAVVGDLHEPATASGTVTARIHALRRTWSEALAGQAPPDKDLTAVNAHFEAGEWLQAARAIAALSRPSQQALGPAPAGGRREIPVPSEPAALPVAFRTFVAHPAPVALAAPALPRRAGTVEAFRLSSLGELARAKFFQTLLVAILLSFVAYALFAERFVGTARDCLAIFFWAFGLDLSVDALVNAAKPLKPAGAPAT
jgi:hypothetical protein